MEQTTERTKEYQKEYAKRRAAYKAQRSREWRAKHPDIRTYNRMNLAAYRKRQFAIDPDGINRYQREWYAANKRRAR